jgi:hypothetical protein
VDVERTGGKVDVESSEEKLVLSWHISDISDSIYCEHNRRRVSHYKPDTVSYLLCEVDTRPTDPYDNPYAHQFMTFFRTFCGGL